MGSLEKTAILSPVDRERYVGKSEELDQLLRHAKGHSESRGLAVLAKPGSGLSELLMQTYDQLFYEQGDVIPFYFRFKKSDKTIEQFAVRFLQSFLQQVIAFRRNDPSVLAAAPDICELSELAVPSDGDWIEKLIETCEASSRLNDQASFVRQALSAPLRAAQNGAQAFVLIDDLQNASFFAKEQNLVEELKETFSRSSKPYVLGGKRRFVFDAAQTGEKTLDDIYTLELGDLEFTDSGLFAENLSSIYKLNITDQTRDLIAQQFDGNPTFIKFLFQTANDLKIDLDTFGRVEETYVEALFGGKIKGYYDSVFDEIVRDASCQKRLIALLYEAFSLRREKTPAEAWRSHLGLQANDFYQVIEQLHANEIIRFSSNRIEAMTENEILKDYVDSRYYLEIREASRSLVIAETLAELLKRAPVKMAIFYRQRSAIGLRELMSVFDCQEVPRSLIDYESYRDSHKGNDPEKISEQIASEKSAISLPQIIYTAHTVSLYSPIEKLTEVERSAVALGFEGADYKDEKEIVWIAAEIDSKLEANEELTSFWLDRLEMVALMCDFSRFRLWLVSPEGFSQGALEILKSRNAMGSSRAQIKLLAKYLDAEDLVEEKLDSNEYEMVLPMGDDTELIAAYAVEEIARRHSFDTKAINQMKTALVEACINASEHSHSPDRKIYQKFKIEDDRIVITISNRGLRFKGKETNDIEPDEGRRGWGLKLMKTLMDDVKFEQVDDGTRISMTKKLQPQA